MKFQHETHIAFNDLRDQFAKGRSSYRGKRQKNERPCILSTRGYRIVFCKLYSIHMYE